MPATDSVSASCPCGGTLAASGSADLCKGLLTAWNAAHAGHRAPSHPVIGPTWPSLPSLPYPGTYPIVTCDTSNDITVHARRIAREEIDANDRYSSRRLN